MCPAACRSARCWSLFAQGSYSPLGGSERRNGGTQISQVKDKHAPDQQHVYYCTLYMRVALLLKLIRTVFLNLFLTVPVMWPDPLFTVCEVSEGLHAACDPARRWLMNIVVCPCGRTASAQAVGGIRTRVSASSSISYESWGVMWW